MYEDHEKNRDKFEVFAIHDKSAKSLKEMDGKLTNIKDVCWQGKDLPFPILLDDGGKTEEIFGVEAHPTSILIDPDGNVVADVHSSALEAMLPKLPASKRLARIRDMYRNQVDTYTPGKLTMEKFRSQLERDVGCKIEFDEKVMESLELTPEMKLPILLHGRTISFRTIEHLMLTPLGLQLRPAEDPQKLVLGKIEGTPEFSDAQKKDNDALNKQLDDSIEKIEVESQSLLSFVKWFAGKANIRVAADTKSLKAKKLDPELDLSGVVEGDSLRSALKKFLESHDLNFRVEAGVVIIQPR